MSDQLVTLVAGQSDVDLAAEIRAEMRPLLDRVVEVQNRASRAGLQVGFQLARDQFGRSFVQSVDVFKPL
jgi:hypothetical protein